MKNGEVQEPTGLCAYIYRDIAIGGCVLNAMNDFEKVFDDESMGRENNNVMIVAWYGYYRAVPRYYERPRGWTGPMFGGDFIWSSDSRWREKYPHPIPLHDRYENP